MDPPAVQYVRTPDGFDIAYCASGNGEPLVLMPLPISHLRNEWNSATYGPLLKALSERYRLVRYDDRGSGMSSRGLSEDFQASDFERDLRCVLDRIGLERVVLVGRIVTGNAAVKFTLAHPERVKALVLWNTFRDYQNSFARSHLALARTHWEHVLRTAGRAVYHADADVLAVEMARAAMERQDFMIRVQVLERYSIARDLPRLRIPVLVLVSRVPDPQVEHEAQLIAATVPGARLQVIDNVAGQTGMQAVEAIEDFLVSLSANASLEARLSGREIEVLRLVAAGKSNREIGQDLVISVNTVARHLSNVFDKLGAANRAEAVASASRQGLL